MSKQGRPWKHLLIPSRVLLTALTWFPQRRTSALKDVLGAQWSSVGPPGARERHGVALSLCSV